MIRDFIQKKSEENADKFLINIDGKHITYSCFEKKINAFQAYLITQKKTIKKVSICYDDQFLVLSALIACNREKIIPIIIPRGYFSSKNNNYNNLIDTDFELNNNCIIQYKEKISQKKYEYNEYDVQCILFTSGTDSVPKAVQLTFINIYHSALSWNKIVNFSYKDNYLNVLPIHHISGLSIFFRALYCNFNLFSFKYDKKNILKIIDKYNINCTSLVPKILIDLIKKQEAIYILKKFKIIIIGGDKINEKIFNFLNINNINGYISYGLTETSSGISGYFIKDEKNYIPGYLGSCHPGSSILIENEKIKIISKSVMLGYIKDKLCNGEYLTSDYGYLKNNKLFFKSRTKKNIVSGGENINLDIIEKTISNYDSNLKFIVTSTNCELWGEKAVVLISDNSDLGSINQLKEYCSKNLSKYIIPKHFILIDTSTYEKIFLSEKQIKQIVIDNLK